MRTSVGEVAAVGVRHAAGGKHDCRGTEERQPVGTLHRGHYGRGCSACIAGVSAEGPTRPSSARAHANAKRIARVNLRLYKATRNI